MIVSKDISPERDVYYLGARIIDIISVESEPIDFFDVYEKINASDGVSMNLYSLILDWLYIVGVIENSGNGSIKKCF